MPPFGGFNPTLLRIELKRMLRNRRTIIFTLVFPAAMFFVFGSGSGWHGAASAPATSSAYIMVSMALYGGALIAAAAGAVVAVERALGWSRQLRLTPLHPAAYILVKAFVALVMGALAIARGQRRRRRAGQAADAGRRVGRVRGCSPWSASMTFAALGVFVGYLVPGENVMQVLGPGLALLAFLGGLFIPLEPVQPDRARHRLLDADVRRRRGRPRAADPGAALVRRRQRRRLAGRLRARRRVADEQGHRPGLTASVTTHERRHPDRGPDAGRAGAGGSVFAAIWLFFLLDPLAAAWDARDTVAGVVGRRRDRRLRRVYMTHLGAAAPRPQRLRADRRRARQVARLPRRAAGASPA